ncbi:MAG: transketolase [Flavobacteriaceae bacterium]|nr:transketolase [Flavobacteriaceae bacterium]
MNSCKIIANTIRGLSVDGVAAANSGHPGMPLGMADVCAVLWSEHMNFNPKNPKWLNRDRFILSAGHGSMLIYSLLHLYGYDLSMDDLKAFRQWGSKTPGHPENFVTAGVETTTGPLGQGVANAVGFALAEASLAARYNREGSEIIDHYTYVVAGDGCLQEGISHEACSFAGHNKLGKLIMLYDSNNITIDGPTHISFTEDTRKRFEAYGWQVLEIDGHDYDQINSAIAEAKKEKSKPSIIICKTIIGFGSPNRAGTSKAHGEPFPAEEIELMKEKLGLPKDKSFIVPDEISDLRAKTQEKGESLENQWNELWENYKNKNQEAAKELENSIKGEISKEALDIPLFGSEKAIATRSASGTILNHIAKYIPQLMGGSADLTPSNNTLPAGEESFSPENPKGRYIRYGVREHGMAAIMNGMALHGGVLPYSGTFFVFSDYMRPAMRMSALMEQQVVYVLTHDSIGLGEDGPTHQPEAHLWAYRMIPNMTVIRPMDANETAEAWKSALKNKKGPTCLVLTRQNLPVYDRAGLGWAKSEEAQKGGYVLCEDKDFEAIIIATGSEVELAVEAKAKLNEQGVKVRIVSMPSTNIFDEQPQEYKESVLPKNILKRVAVEAGVTLGWYKYVGLEGRVIGLDRFGASAPYKTLYKEFGITTDAIVEAVNSLK